MIKLPFPVANPGNLVALPPYYSETLFSREELLGWYVADAENLTRETLYDLSRVTAWADMSPLGNNLTATAANGFVFEEGDEELNGASYLRTDGTDKRYVFPGTWTTGDHSKIHLFKATTPAANRYINDGGSGDGRHRIYLSTLDRIISDVDGSTITRTRDPDVYNLAVTSWSASDHIQGMALNQEEFQTVAAVGTADCGSTAPTIGGAQGGVTGSSGTRYREIGFLNVALHKTENATLWELIKGRFKTYYGIELAP